MNNLLFDFIKYIGKPKYYIDNPNLTKRDKSLKTFKLTSWSLLAGIISSLILVIALKLANYQGENAVVELSKNEPLIIIFITAVVLAPIIEEFVFRLALKFRPSYLSIMSFIILFMIVPSYASFFPKTIIFELLYLVLCIVLSLILFMLIRIKRINSFISNIYINHFRWIFYLLTILFSLSHIQNYNNLLSVFYLIPILGLPQLFFSFSNSYIRMNYGFIYAIAAHSLFNLSLTIPTLLPLPGTILLLFILGYGFLIIIQDIFNFIKKN
ncbi:MAG: hypothetical protein WCJ19_00860 [bacterium]